jgi:non-homologous end joining protein Ku
LVPGRGIIGTNWYRKVDAETGDEVSTDIITGYEVGTDDFIELAEAVNARGLSSR